GGGVGGDRGGWGAGGGAAARRSASRPPACWSVTSGARPAWPPRPARWPANSPTAGALAIRVSRHTALRILLRLPLPPPPGARVLGVDDFALRKRHRYATILIDAETRERIDVLPGRSADALEDWLREQPAPGWRAGTAPAPTPEAIRRALPDAVEVGDHWHIWHNLAEALRKEVAPHSACRATLPAKDGTRAVTTRERWAQVHALLDQGVGLLE